MSPLLALALLAAPVVERSTEAGGDHWRIAADEGVVHVWRPKGYQAAKASTVVYLHGYYTTTDAAWTEHKLAEQFSKSARNALFVVPQSPIGNEEEVFFEDLQALLRMVTRAVKVRLPDGLVATYAHSGGFRTVVPWLTYGRLDLVVLIDGLYGDPKPFSDWLRRGHGHQSNRLVLVGLETAEKSELFAKSFKLASMRDAIPEDAKGLDKADLRAQLLYLKSQIGHMELITEGVVLPLLLEASPIAKVRK